MRSRHTRPMYSSILLACTLPFTLTPPLLADDLPLTLSNPSSTSLPAWPAPTPVLATSDGQVTPAIDFGPPADQRVPSTLDGVTFNRSQRDADDRSLGTIFDRIREEVGECAFDA